MNYFAHAMLFLDRPYFVAGASVPDWLSVVDRRVRVRSKQVEAFLSDADGLTAEVAAGVLQHLRDDARFHEGRAFAETMLGLTAQTRDALDGETGMRPAFLGHLLTELLLDASLIAEDGRRLSRYYGVLDQVDAQRVEAAVNRFAPRATNRLAAFIELFRQAQVLYDYGEDGKLMVRLNQVLQRVGLEPLPDSFVAMLPEARGFVSERKQTLLDWRHTGAACPSETLTRQVDNLPPYLASKSCATE